MDNSSRLIIYCYTPPYSSGLIDAHPHPDQLHSSRSVLLLAKDNVPELLEHTGGLSQGGGHLVRCVYSVYSAVHRVPPGSARWSNGSATHGAGGLRVRRGMKAKSVKMREL